MSTVLTSEPSSLHPQVHAFLDAIAEQNPPGWNELGSDEGRRVFAGLSDLFGVGPQIDSVEDRLIADSIAIRIYRPAPGRRPVIVFFHGGGWVLGDLDTHDALCRRLAVESGCVVVSVDYRRAPEHRFPAAIDDCYAATAYVSDHAHDLGIDPQALAVAGDSAGGNLAAAVAVRARDANGPPIAAQFLIYPAIEPRCDSRTYQTFATGYGLTRADMVWFWKQYLNGRSDEGHAWASLGCADSLHGLPPVYVVTAECDVLRDEGEAFAAQLANAGTHVETRRYDGMIHGFLHFAGAFDVGLQATSDLARVARSMLGGK